MTNENDSTTVPHSSLPQPSELKIEQLKERKLQGRRVNLNTITSAEKRLRKAVEKRKRQKYNKWHSVNKRDKHIEKSEREVARLKEALALTTPGKPGIITEDKLDDLPPNLTKEIKENTRIIWQPDPENRPQIAFLQASEEEVMFSGARGSGKTDALIADPLRYVHNPNFKGLIIRKTMKRLREIMSRARKIYLQAVPGTRWKEQEKIFIFPSGATLEFGYCDTDTDLDQYIGQEYIWLGIDEITQYPEEVIIETLRQSLRTTDPTLKRMIRVTANPGGPGHRWVKARFVDLGPTNTKIIIDIKTDFGNQTITRKWIHSLTTDNSILMKNDPNYLVSLHSIQNETLKRQWLFGDWDAAEGLAFSEFSKKTHVVKPFNIPNNWLRFRACDWGYSTMAVCLWLAIDFDNNIYVYREYLAGDQAGNKQTAPYFAKSVLALENQERIKYGVLDTSTWSNRGDSGPSIAEEMIMNGCLWRASDGSSGSRIAGKMQIHQYLKVNELGKPKLFIFDTCKELISELASLPLDDKNPEDVDTNAKDHAYDALRYGLMSRPQIASDYFWRESNGSLGTNATVVVDKAFGY